MAYITLHPKKLQDNYQKLDQLFLKHEIEWSPVSKVLCGNKLYLRELIHLGIHQICDSRVSNLKAIRSINKEIETVYIKPPAKRSISSIVKYADVSFNTEYATIKMLSEEAVKQNKLHKVVIMIELGELREGVMREDLIDFYQQVFDLPNIEIAGIGTNLTCMYGVLPNHDKLIQLSIYRQLIEVKFNQKIPYISGGASVTIPLIERGLLPKGINHFRVGETLFLGTDVYNNKPFESMHNDVFTLYAEIIELGEKPTVPIGEMGYNLNHEKKEFDERLQGESTLRAIVDIGLLDIEPEHIQPKDKSIKIIGESSDMFVLDLDDKLKGKKIGDLIPFSLDYMGLLRIMNSKYIEKRIESVEDDSIQ